MLEKISPKIFYKKFPIILLPFTKSVKLISETHLSCFHSSLEQFLTRSSYDPRSYFLLKISCLPVDNALWNDEFGSNPIEIFFRECRKINDTNLRFFKTWWTFKIDDFLAFFCFQGPKSSRIWFAHLNYYVRWLEWHLSYFLICSEPRTSAYIKSNFEKTDFFPHSPYMSVRYRKG